MKHFPKYLATFAASVAIYSCSRAPNPSFSTKDVGIFDTENVFKWAVCARGDLVLVNVCPEGTPLAALRCDNPDCGTMNSIPKDKFFASMRTVDTGNYAKDAGGLQAINDAISLETNPARLEQLKAWKLNITSFVDLATKLSSSQQEAVYTEAKPEFWWVLEANDAYETGQRLAARYAPCRNRYDSCLDKVAGDAAEMRRAFFRQYEGRTGFGDGTPTHAEVVAAARANQDFINAGIDSCMAARDQCYKDAEAQ